MRAGGPIRSLDDDEEEEEEEDEEDNDDDEEDDDEEEEDAVDIDVDNVPLPSAVATRAGDVAVVPSPVPGALAGATVEDDDEEEEEEEEDDDEGPLPKATSARIEPK